ncbi:hypothetical protein BV898_03161 [Hypsibius exemplaris]|uniref:Nuclear receptor domain-containing protein n=1 Tax=Hypsibius exemplaris TaxID=2072580 RepID=A0A1W0X5W0_HYPEX|nr:hypothetical protein BV898_03161 [Hypsibius exemplaris]
MKCEICGKLATGINYGVWSCEGCKAFYRRGIDKKLTYTCLNGSNNCVVKPGAKGCCKACRFQKCKVVGMSIYGSDSHNVVPVSSKTVLVKSPKSHKRVSKEQKKPPESSATAVKPIICKAEPAVNQIGKGFDSKLDCENDADYHHALVTWNNKSPSPHIRKTISPSDMAIVPDISIHSGDEETVYSITEHIIPLSRRSSQDFIFADFCRSDPLKHSHQSSLLMTAQSVAIAVELVFSDQISLWEDFRSRIVDYGEVPYQPETSLELMIDAVTQHNSDNVARVQKFTSMLPGISYLDLWGTSSITVGWKWMVFWMIHHSAYFTQTETYITLGPKNLHFCRYWQNILHDWSLVVFIYKFCRDLQEIGLTLIEKYFLIPIVMFEPDIEGTEKNPEMALRLEHLHKHYTDVLFNMIKTRCGASHLTMTCKRLEQFFNALKKVYTVHKGYNRAVEAKRVLNEIATTQSSRIWWREDDEFHGSAHPCVWWKSNHEFHL